MPDLTMTIFCLNSSCFTHLYPPNNHSSLAYTKHCYNKDQSYCGKHIDVGDELGLKGNQTSCSILDELIEVCQENTTSCENQVSSLPIQCDITILD